MGKVAFVTNAREYAGAPAVDALVGAGWDVVCHDASFASPDARASYQQEQAGRYAASALSPAEFVAEGLARFGRIDALISNDIPAISRFCGSRDMLANFFAEEGDPFRDFEDYLDSLVAQPVRLLRAAIPAMRAAGAGNIVLITSGAPLRTPSAGGPQGYTSARAATNALAKSLAVELASNNIQVNAVAPAVLYSPTFFPSDEGADDPRFQPFVESLVPMRRFGAPEEIGALIAQLVSGDMNFVSGQIIAFSGAGC